MHLFKNHEPSWLFSINFDFVYSVCIIPLTFYCLYFYILINYVIIPSGLYHQGLLYCVCVHISHQLPHVDRQWVQTEGGGFVGDEGEIKEKAIGCKDIVDYCLLKSVPICYVIFVLPIMWTMDTVLWYYNKSRNFHCYFILLYYLVFKNNDILFIC